MLLVMLLFLPVLPLLFSYIIIYCQYNIPILYKKVDNCYFYATINNRPGDILVSTSPAHLPQKKVIYLNNRDLLKQIHLSKNTYCSFLDPKNDHQYDIILPSLSKINQRTVSEARRNRADRIKKETGVVVDQKKIPNTDLVFRITSWEHIPPAPKKILKSATKKKKLKIYLILI
jgi:hypothetical protein